jgi:hypothetical protein
MPRQRFFGALRVLIEFKLSAIDTRRGGAEMAGAELLPSTHHPVSISPSPRPL